MAVGEERTAAAPLPHTGILDVARASGVSPATVSRVINGTAKVSPAAQKAVQSAIRQLHYEPNKFARSLITNRSGLIGVLIDRSIKYATANVLVQIEEAASLMGYMSVVLTVDQPFRERYAEALSKLRSLSVEGVLIIAPRVGLPEAVVDCGAERPVVVISSCLEDAGVPVVGEDQCLGAVKAVEHLISKGHRDIWHVAGSQDWFDERQRLKGWRDALQAHGLGNGVLVQATWSPESAYRAVMDADMRRMPDAVFVASDHMALAVIAALRTRGVRVPEDISVVGYDDADGSAYANPPLTTVRQDLPAVARRAVTLLIDAMQGADIAAVTAMEPELVVRESVIDVAASA